MSKKREGPPLKRVEIERIPERDLGSTVVFDGRSGYGNETYYIKMLRKGVGTMAPDVCNIAAAYGSFEAIGMTQQEVEKLGWGKVIENKEGRRFYWEANR